MDFDTQDEEHGVVSEELVSLADAEELDDTALADALRRLRQEQAEGDAEGICAHNSHNSSPYYSSPW